MSEDYFDKGNAKSLFNMVPETVRKEMLNVDPFWFEYSEDELIQKAYGNEKSIPLMDRKLRFRVWNIYGEFAQHHKQMRLIDICKGICDPRSFNAQVMKDHGRFVYIMTEPPDYWTTMEDMLHLSIPEMRDILLMEAKPHPRSGVIDIRLLDLKFKIFQYLDQRQKGSIVQRQETKNLNLNIDASAQQKPQTLAEVEEQLQLLRKEALDSLPSPEVQPILLPVERVVVEAGKDTHKLKGDQ